MNFKSDFSRGNSSNLKIRGFKNKDGMTSSTQRLGLDKNDDNIKRNIYTETHYSLKDKTPSSKKEKKKPPKPQRTEDKNK